jgi:ribonucleotide monophosphatase NagD (HAD superfamily)
VLAIGDGVATDVAGANAQGLDLLFIAGGIHGGELVDGRGWPLDPATEAMLLAAGARAAYAMPALAW